MMCVDMRRAHGSSLLIYIYIYTRYASVYMCVVFAWYVTFVSSLEKCEKFRVRVGASALSSFFELRGSGKSG